MELLLDLVWIILAVGALYAVIRNQAAKGETTPGSRVRAILAITCVVFLLFPVISASDDLHPTLIILEDASKRLCQASASVPHDQGVQAIALLPTLLAIYALFTLVALRSWLPTATDGRVLEGLWIPRDGRSPPLF